MTDSLYWVSLGSGIPRIPGTAQLIIFFDPSLHHSLLYQQFQARVIYPKVLEIIPT